MKSKHFSRMAGNPLHVLSSTALGLSSAAPPEYAIDTEPGLDDFLSEHVAVFNEDWGENWKHECRENLRKIVLETEPSLRPLTEPIMWTLLNMSGNENARKAHEGWVHFNIVPSGSSIWRQWNSGERACVSSASWP